MKLGIFLGLGGTPKVITAPPPLHVILASRDLATDPIGVGEYLVVEIGDYTEILLVASGLSTDVSARLSTDGGSTFLDTSGDYTTSFRANSTGGILANDSDLYGILNGANGAGLWSSAGGNGEPLASVQISGGGTNHYETAGRFALTTATHIGFQTTATSGYLRVLGIN